MPLIKHSLGMTSYQAPKSYNLGLVTVMLKICHQININIITHHPNNFINHNSFQTLIFAQHLTPKLVILNFGMAHFITMHRSINNNNNSPRNQSQKLAYQWGGQTDQLLATRELTTRDLWSVDRRSSTLPCYWTCLQCESDFLIMYRLESAGFVRLTQSCW